MRITSVTLHNFRSYVDACFHLQKYSLLVGANNAGKSNFAKALLVFYEKQSPGKDDYPLIGTSDDDSWIEVCYEVTQDEYDNLPEKYQNAQKQLRVRKY